jgi:acetyl-CoA synthetase
MVPAKEICMPEHGPMMRTVFGDHTRFVKTYFDVSGLYFTGDGPAEDGFYWLTGRST